MLQHFTDFVPLSPTQIPSHTDDRTLGIRLAMVEHETRLTRVEQDLTAAEALVMRLRRERDEARLQVDTHHALLSPIRRMPLEMMQEIFIHCLPTDTFIKPNACVSPMVLTQVCSSWRRLALSTSRLWSSLYIMISNRNASSRIQLMRAWLERSNQLPIALFLCAPSASTANIRDVYSLVAANLHRMKHLRMSVPHAGRDQLIDDLNRGTPILEDLEVRLSGYSSERINFGAPSTTGELAPSASSAPRLRALSWMNNTHIYRTVCHFESSTITELSMTDSLSVKQCVAILAGCPSLRICRFSSLEWPAEQFTAEIPLTHHALKHLSINARTYLGPLFDRLTLPALEILRLTDAEIDVEDEIESQLWHQASFTSLIERSQCALAELQLGNLLSSEDELVASLQITSRSLAVLHVSDIRGITTIMDRTLGLLTVRHAVDGTPSCLCPRLEIIKFGTCLASTDGVLADMIESRWKASEALVSSSDSKFAVVRPRYINPRLAVDHPEDLRRLMALRAEGLEMAVY